VLAGLRREHDADLGAITGGKRHFVGRVGDWRGGALTCPGTDVHVLPNRLSTSKPLRAPYVLTVVVGIDLYLAYRSRLPEVHTR